jgi:glycosyltransferase involved in cell wall biosynthesis
MKVLVVTPAWNEAANIQRTLAGVREALPGADVVVVDDGSHDATRALATGAGATVLTHPFNLGYGAALQTGFLYARDHGYDAVVQIDADGQHDPRSAAAMVRVLGESGADVVLGSRFLGAGDYRPSALRAAGIRLMRRLVRAATGEAISDPTSGFQALGRRVVALYASDLFPADYPDADVLIMILRAGMRVREVPVVMHAREAGSSMHDGLKPVWYMFKMLLSILVTVLRDPPAMPGEEA